MASICDALIKLAVLGPDVENLAVQGIATRVAVLVRELLNGADGERWLSLSGLLSELAEAAPTEFLGAIEKSLLDQEPAVARLITETGHSGFLGGRCWYADLLRGLEVLAWQPQYLTRVVDVLVKLTKFPRAGNWVNSPAHTLLSIFRSWLPQTAAPLEQRIKLLDRVIYLDKGAAWQLFADLVLKDSDFASSNARPKWRDDDAGAGFGTTRGEMHHMLIAAADHLVALANGNPPYLAKLIKEFDHLDPERRSRVISMASEFAKVGADDHDRALLREAVREYIAFHKRFDVRREQFAQDAAAIEELQQKLQPKTLAARYAWLFKNAWVGLDDDAAKVSFEDQSRRIEQKRTEALREMHSEGGMQEIERFINDVSDPHVLGRALAGVFQNIDQVVDWLSSKKSNLNPSSNLGRTVQGLMFQLRDLREGVTAKITDVGMAGWSSDELINFYLDCPSDKITWQQIERTDEVLQSNYWVKVMPMLVGTSPDEINELARRMLAANRPRTAFVATEIFFDKVEPELLYQMLDGMRKVSEEGVRLPDAWHISQSLNRIEKAGNVGAKDLALLEFSYAGLLSHSERGLRSLGKLVTSDPSIFAELVSGVYKAHNAPEPEEISEQQKNFAAEAWTVLHNLKRVPGQQDDGSVDPEALVQWVTASRKLCREADRAEVGDNVIGEILSRARADSDGIWPHEGVRDVLEREDAEHLRHGFLIGTYNNRGVVSRGYDEGGTQERELAKRYEKYALALSKSHPRVADMIRSLQKGYEEDARREDLDAKLRIEGGV